MTYREYLIAVIEEDALRARELRSMLRNYRGDEVLPGVFRVTLSPTQQRSIVASADQLRGRLRFAEPAHN